jgi:hypothetical protein
MLTGAPAAAATLELFVNNTVQCSDDGAGSSVLPFCTVGAAARIVVPGQTVTLYGTFNERLTITRSGTPEQPIVFRQRPYPGGTSAWLSGPEAGITISGVHDIVIREIGVHPAGTTAGVTVNASTRIGLQRLTVSARVRPIPVGVQFIGVTDSSVVNTSIYGDTSVGVALDAGTTRVRVSGLRSDLNRLPGSRGIEVDGSGNVVIINLLTNLDGPAIHIRPGAHDNVVANNAIGLVYGRTIVNTDANHTAITNNTVGSSCGTGIRVDGTSSGVSVQNNVIDNGSMPTGFCPTVPTGEVAIGVYDDAATGTTVDYNNTSLWFDGPEYAWRIPMDLTTFRSVSGQGVHDLVTTDRTTQIDSANAGAPGFQLVDPWGRVVVDHPEHPNTGTGPVSYADRGYSERRGAPVIRLALSTRRDSSGRLASVIDASATTAWAPLTVASYTFDFGDGTGRVSQASPVVTHVYRGTGTYQVTVWATDSNHSTASISANWQPNLSARSRTTGPTLPTRRRTAW